MQRLVDLLGGLSPNSTMLDVFSTRAVLQTALSVVGLLFVVVVVMFMYTWRRTAQRKFQEIKDAVPPLLLMKRVKWTDKESLDSSSTRTSGVQELAGSLDLTLDYIQKMRHRGTFDKSGAVESIQVMSLGDYLASLRPAGPTKAMNAHDVELLLGAALLKILGPAVGTALLPVLGVLPTAVQTAAGLGGLAVTATAVSGAQQSKTVGERVAVSGTAAIVKAVGGMSLLGAAGAADLAAAVARARMGWDGDAQAPTADEMATSDVQDSAKEEETENGQAKQSGSDAQSQPPRDPLAIMRRGETNPSTFGALPNPFVMSIHWNKALEGMEESIRSKFDSYNPNEHATGQATPVRDMLLPDLHVGMAGIRCTLSNREILANRLVSILFNKLATIDILEEIQDEQGNRPAQPFCVKMTANDEPIYRPDDLLLALQKSGHSIEAWVTTRITTFGLTLCVKEEPEDDESEESRTETWTHIPLGFHLRTGLQDPTTGRSISTFLTHGAIDLTIRGPLIHNVVIQYYHNQEGFDGWSSGHYPDAPWACDPSGLRKIDNVIRAVRLAGLLSCCENSVGSRFRLPLGGYGLSGVCTDSAAAVEFALVGKTGVYPILGIGGYKSHVVRRANELRLSIEKRRKCKQSGAPSKEVVRDIAKLCDALSKLPNDVHPIPSSEADTAQRILQSCTPNDPAFQLMVDERDALTEIASFSPTQRP